MGELEQEQERPRGGVSIWRTARGAEPRWKVTAPVGLDEAELDRAREQAVRLDRELEREYARKLFKGTEPPAE